MRPEMQKCLVKYFSLALVAGVFLLNSISYLLVSHVEEFEGTNPRWLLYLCLWGFASIQIVCFFMQLRLPLIHQLFFIPIYLVSLFFSVVILIDATNVIVHSRVGFHEDEKVGFDFKMKVVFTPLFQVFLFVIYAACCFVLFLASSFADYLKEKLKL